MNENPSVCIESAGTKTCDNRPLKNGSAISNCSIILLVVKSSALCERSCIQNNKVTSLFVSPHKNKGIFLETS